MLRVFDEIVRRIFALALVGGLLMIAFSPLFDQETPNLFAAFTIPIFGGAAYATARICW